MAKSKLTVTGTGDSLFLTKFPREYDEKIKGVADFINGCDIKLTNLETNLSDFEYFANAYSGGTWLNTRRAFISELLRYGFNYFGNANNHAMDYSYNGLLSTIDTLDKLGLAHSGTGRSLDEAKRPAILEANGNKVAVFAVDASMELASKAGYATHELKARPGVNFLRHESTYQVNEEELNFLRSIAKKTKLNFSREFSIATGYATPDPEGVFMFGKNKFTTKTGIPETQCNKKDLTRIITDIKTAKEHCDYVFLLVHCHDSDGTRVENPPQYLVEFSHACIDAGASAIFGGGCHRLRPMEIYNGVPIFYSLADFIYQGLKIEYLPADFMEQYGADIYLSAEQALWVRSRGGKVGLHCEKKNYQTFLPKIEFQDGKMTGLAMLPVYLNFDKKGDLNGLPEVADKQEAREILDLMNELSAQYGVKLKMENGMMSVEQ